MSRSVRCDKNVFKERIREARKKKDFTQQELADKVYVARKYISELENGRKSPDAMLLYNLAIELDVSADYLIGYSNNPSAMEVNSVIWGVIKIMKKYPRDKQGIILSGMQVLDDSADEKRR